MDGKLGRGALGEVGQKKSQRWTWPNLNLYFLLGNASMHSPFILLTISAYVAHDTSFFFLHM